MLLGGILSARLEPIFIKNVLNVLGISNFFRKLSLHILNFAITGFVTLPL